MPTRVAGCFLEYDGKFVILLRHAHKPSGNKWGLPGGKVETDEDDISAARRELEEETGYVAKPEQLLPLGVFDFFLEDGRPAQYAAFSVKLSTPHEVTLEQHAHSAFAWVTPEQCDSKPDVLPGLRTLLRSVKYLS